MSARVNPTPNLPFPNIPADPAAIVQWDRDLVASLMLELQNHATAINQMITINEVREILTADRTYYVRTDGDDGNIGTANTPGDAFRTIQHAINVAYTLDGRTFNITIQVAPGTYSEQVVLNGPFLTSGTFTLRGDGVTPSTTVINAGAGTGIHIFNGCSATIFGFKLIGGAGIIAQSNCILLINARMEYGACTYYHFFVGDGANVTIFSSYTISGSAQFHLVEQTRSGFTLSSLATVTLTGTPAFISFVDISFQSMCSLNGGSSAFQGAATGKRYKVAGLSLLALAGTAAESLPGNAAGSRDDNSVIN